MSEIAEAVTCQLSNTGTYYQAQYFSQSLIIEHFAHSNE